jgi:hypothetical protein
MANAARMNRTSGGWGTLSSASFRSENKRRPYLHMVAPTSVPGIAVTEAPTVRDFVVPAPVRLAQQIASASMVRDVAAFGAVVLFATMLAVLW